MGKLNLRTWLTVWALVAGAAAGAVADAFPRAIKTTDAGLADLNASGSDSSESWWYDWLATLAKPIHDLRELKERLKWRPKLGRDPIELAGLPEGDILPHPQVGVTKKNGAQDKNAVSETMRLWPDGVVPYQFSTAFLFLPLERYVIEQVMADIGRHSCARFVERTDQVDYVTIIYDRDKCYSHIGRVGGPQPLSLGFFCVRWWDQGTIYHELLHSLGFFHEHNRPDRDSYVEILWDNISWGQDKNFRKRSYSTVELIDLPYDFESVMHYNPYAFSKWYFLAPTIKSRAKGASFKRAKKPTAKDYNKLNRLYRCRREGRSHYSHLGYSGPSPRWFQDNGYNVSAIVPPPPPSTISSPRMIRDGSERHLSGAAGRSKASQFLDPISRLQFRGLPANPWLKNRAPTPRAQILTPRNFIVPTSTPQFRDRLPDSELTQIISSNTQINTLPQAITSKPWMSDFVENQYLLHFETRNLANDTDITTFNKSMTLAPTQVRLPDPAMTPLALTGRQVGQELRRLKSRTKSFPGRHRIISRNLP